MSMYYEMYTEIFRFPDPNYGRQSARVCAVKKVESEKPLCNFFAQKHQLINRNIERWINLNLFYPWHNTYDKEMTSTDS